MTAQLPTDLNVLVQPRPSILSASRRPSVQRVKVNLDQNVIIPYEKSEVVTRIVLTEELPAPAVGSDGSVEEGADESSTSTSTSKPTYHNFYILSFSEIPSLANGDYEVQDIRVDSATNILHGLLSIRVLPSKKRALSAAVSLNKWNTKLSLKLTKISARAARSGWESYAVELPCGKGSEFAQELQGLLQAIQEKDSVPSPASSPDDDLCSSCQRWRMALLFRVESTRLKAEWQVRLHVAKVVTREASSPGDLMHTALLRLLNKGDAEIDVDLSKVSSSCSSPTMSSTSSLPSPVPAAQVGSRRRPSYRRRHNYSDSDSDLNTERSLLEYSTPSYYISASSAFDVASRMRAL
ncbi:hypothetical protein DFS34DRAFT_626464 [Phlyctochytrium arcticum]|nr:hypothetical protein DFS34DRAFT_626464 [Phlyctochytrium arcticum]